MSGKEIYTSNFPPLNTIVGEKKSRPYWNSTSPISEDEWTRVVSKAIIDMTTQEIWEHERKLLLQADFNKEKWELKIALDEWLEDMGSLELLKNVIKEICNELPIKKDIIVPYFLLIYDKTIEWRERTVFETEDIKNKLHTLRSRYKIKAR